jgi:hypothetical protein
VPAGQTPQGIAVSADGRSAYVANGNGDTVSQYSIARDGALVPKVPAALPTDDLPVRVAVNPPIRIPTSKDQCKHGGWRTFTQFKNRGQCVAFLAPG